jgi:hypothetical protein
MHCPRCGQGQASGDMRYCSRCGFPLAGVSQLLATGGTEALPQPAAESPKRRGVKQGAIVIFVAMALAPLLAPLLEEVGAVIIGTLFMAGMMRMLYAALFQEGAPRATAPVAHQQFGQHYVQPPPRQAALPPPYAPPAEFPRERVKTAELVEPPSVTENTTRLLEEEREGRR